MIFKSHQIFKRSFDVFKRLSASGTSRYFLFLFLLETFSFHYTSIGVKI